MTATPVQVIQHNRKANHHYHITETMESGLCLLGTEIKSLRTKGCNLTEAFVRLKKNEVYVMQMEIPQYEYGHQQNHDPRRPRKLLLKKREIQQLEIALEKKQLTCVPLKLYLKRGLAKLLIGIGRSKKLYDKRESLKKKDAQREIERATRLK